MTFEATTGSLRALGEEFFRLAEQLGGSQPTPRDCDDWLKAASDERAYCFMKFVGPTARKFHPNSLVLNTAYHDTLAIDGAQRGDDWFSQPSIAYSVRPDVPEDVERGREFIRQAFKLYGR